MSYYIEKKINFIVLIMIVDLKLRQEKVLNHLVKHFFIIQKIKFNKFPEGTYDVKNGFF